MVRVRRVACDVDLWSFYAARRTSKRRTLPVKNAGLFSGLWRDEPKVPVRGGCGDPAPRRARQKPLLHQERLVHFLERSRIFAHSGRERDLYAMQELRSLLTT